MAGRAASDDAAAVVKHLRRVTPVVLRELQKPVSEECRRGLKWVRLWRARLTAGYLRHVRYKPRTAEELQAFLDRSEALKLKVSKVGIGLGVLALVRAGEAGSPTKVPHARH